MDQERDGTSFHKLVRCVLAPLENPCATLRTMTEHDGPLLERYSRLLSLAAHEFRTPASVVGGYLRMLSRDVEQPLSERQRKMVDEAEKSCARLVALIGELSEISKLDGNTAVFKSESVDLFQLVREVAAGVHEAGDREVVLVVRGEGAGARSTADPLRIRAAFDAFFRAILREQPGKATVVADCRKASDGSAVIVVARDSDVQRAYDAPAAPFDEKRGGLGLVLPIACRVIARHGGRVWSPDLPAQSDTGLGGRSAVVISIPVSAE
jgi:signal transduction histidine kinase